MSKRFNLKHFISAAALMSVTSVALSAPSITLSQTVGTDVTPGACAASSVAVVTLADSVNFCYTVTNDGDAPFDLHALNSSAFGALGVSNGTLAPAATMQFNDIRTLSSDVFNNGTWTASNPPVLNQSTGSGGFEDISGTGTMVAGTGVDGGLSDDGEADLTIPFPFTYFGVTSTDLCVGNNGAAIFGTTGCSVSWNNGSGLTSAVAGMIAPYWDDLGYSDNVGTMYTETLGTAPNRRFIVQWHQEIYYNGDDADNITFQLALFEGTNEIQFRYFDVIFGGADVGNDGGATAEVGLVSPDGSIISVYSSQGSTLLNDGDDVIYTFVPGPMATASSLAAVDVLVPQVSANANGTLVASVEEGASGTGTVDISNTGEGNLNWTMDEAAGNGVIRTPRPISFYTPEMDYSASQFEAPYKDSPNKFVEATKGIKAGLQQMAYALDIGASSFGSFDQTTAGTFTSVGAQAVAHWAGDFVGNDYSKMYAVDDTGNLNTISTADGSITLVAAVTGVDGTSITGLTEDPTDGTVYATAYDGTSSSLYSLDVTTGVATLVGGITNATLIIDVAASATGDLFAVDISSDNLIAIDKATGAGTAVGALGFNANFGQGMDFDTTTNTLYLAALNGDNFNVEIRTVDTATGVSTLVGAPASSVQLDSFGIVSSDSCFAPEDIPWLSLSATSGATAAGNTDQVTVTFDATGLSAGNYDASVCLFSDDPDEPLVKLPVSLTVTLPDLIFKNGFE